MLKKIELLSPAKNLEYGKIAIQHGADAVYIGATKFGARQNASNSIIDIEALTKYAHIYNAKVYVTLNTILFDNELEEVRKICYDLYSCGVDALIVQDMALLEIDLPPIKLHSSTQTNNYELDRIKFLSESGFKRIILARELSIIEIEKIRQNTDCELECFIHGALCVCFSGQCYLSYILNKRSGNRGNCSQPCRLSYDLFNKNGKILKKDSYLLSLKDFNASNHIERLIKAGITTFKIEGRLKDKIYLKNVTAYYRNLLDTLFEKTNCYEKSSSGKTTFFFTPDLERSFNRGYTDYFLDNIRKKNGSLLSQKSIGKEIGKVLNNKDKKDKYIFIDSKYKISNGDGLCYFDNTNKLSGFLVNKVIDKNKILPNKEIIIKKNTKIFRNYDFKFNKLLNNNTCERKININIFFEYSVNGFILTVIDEDDIKIIIETSINKTIAINKIQTINTIKTQLSKLKSTPFTINSFKIKTENIYFIPINILNDTRRKMVNMLIENRVNYFEQIEKLSNKKTNKKTNKNQYLNIIDYTFNIVNKKALDFYRKHYNTNNKYEFGIEQTNNFSNKILMRTKHCIKFELEQCPIYFKQNEDFKKKLFLKQGKNILSLEFDCKNCQMLIKSINKFNNSILNFHK